MYWIKVTKITDFNIRTRLYNTFSFLVTFSDLITWTMKEKRNLLQHKIPILYKNKAIRLIHKLVHPLSLSSLSSSIPPLSKASGLFVILLIFTHIIYVLSYLFLLLQCDIRKKQKKICSPNSPKTLCSVLEMMGNSKTCKLTTWCTSVQLRLFRAFFGNPKPHLSAQ